VEGAVRRAGRDPGTAGASADRPALRRRGHRFDAGAIASANQHGEPQGALGSIAGKTSAPWPHSSTCSSCNRLPIFDYESTFPVWNMENWRGRTELIDMCDQGDELVPVSVAHDIYLTVRRAAMRDPAIAAQPSAMPTPARALGSKQAARSGERARAGDRGRNYRPKMPGTATGEASLSVIGCRFCGDLAIASCRLVIRSLSSGHPGRASHD
jgi:hypothetical protein